MIHLKEETDLLVYEFIKVIQLMRQNNNLIKHDYRLYFLPIIIVG